MVHLELDTADDSLKLLKVSEIKQKMMFTPKSNTSLSDVSSTLKKAEDGKSEGEDSKEVVLEMKKKSNSYSFTSFFRSTFKRFSS